MHGLKSISAGLLLAGLALLPPRSSQERHFSLVEIWRVGGEGASEEAVLQSANIVTAFAPSGDALVLDPVAGRILVLDGGTGAVLRTVGRMGQGPGEFTGPGAMAWGPRNRLWVANPFGSRTYSVFDSAGSYLRQVPRPGRSTAAFVFPMVIRSDGTILDHESVAPQTRLMHLDSTGSRLHEAVVTRPLIELDRRNLPPIIPGSEVGEAARGLGKLRPSIQWAFAQDGGAAWVVRTDSMILTRIGLPEGGRATFTLTHRSPAFTPEQREAVDRLDRALGFEAGYAPSLVERIHVLDDGRVLLQIDPTVTEGEQELDLLDPRGRLYGTVHAPFRVSPRAVMASRGDTLLLTALGQYDEPTVIKAVLQRK